MKQQQLMDLNERFQQKLNEHFGEEIKLVYGAGNKAAPIVLVGEAPGKNEVLQGKPFVGQAGRNLDEFIEILDIKREELYITNTVKFRPYKVNPNTGRESNRPPTKKEIQICKDYILEELEIIKPKLVASLGNVALKCIADNDSLSIGNVHGLPLEVTFGSASFILFPLYHPASIIYRAELKDTYIQDLHKLKDYIKNTIDR